MEIPDESSPRKIGHDIANDVGALVFQVAVLEMHEKIKETPELLENVQAIKASISRITEKTHRLSHALRAQAEGEAPTEAKTEEKK